MNVYTTHQAKTHLSRLLDVAEAGGEVVIAKGRRAVVRLVAVEQEGRPPRPKVGSATSKPLREVEKREVAGKAEDTAVYF